MKKILYSIAILFAAAITSCSEWDPVFANQGVPDPAAAVNMDSQVNTSIAALKTLYTGKPYHIEDDIVIAGKIISSDLSGNIYRSVYIQDETGAIEVKIGSTGLYNDYKLGQTLYVKCEGLTLGNYGGMLQIGYSDPTGEYETAYIDVKSLIDSHIFRGAEGPEISPIEVSEADVNAALKLGYKSPLFGKYVTLKNLTYANEIFVLIYMDSNADKKASSNRLFLSDKQWGVTTWAMSAAKMKEYLVWGVWDTAQIGNSGDYNYGTVGDPANRTKLINNASAYSVSQYFKMTGGTEIQVRSSGYAKFSDSEIDPEILAGKKVDFTGILTNYNGAAQFTLVDIDGVQKH
ncbi:MAG: hypothetical protein J6Z47_04980 [Bacteroidales bacterium]|nr:hypothetical protein [Bacteroidales bacterium]